MTGVPKVAAATAAAAAASRRRKNAVVTTFTTSASLVFMTMLMAGGHVVVLAQQDCNLDCPFDAPCELEAPDFSGHNIDFVGNAGNGAAMMHCACPPGWTGILCDHRFETCTDNHQCYHGGKCIPGLLDDFGNGQLFCDCSDAVAADGTRYVGKYCETPYEKICDDSGELFCVNGGDCNPNFETDGLPCLCDDGYEGYHCEFQAGTVPLCTLQCQNDGQCIVGVDNREDAEANIVWPESTNVVDYMHCVCPDGYGGPLCEHPTEDCGTGVCFNGGECATVNSSVGGAQTVDHFCDCTSATDTDGNVYAGEFCQYKSTVSCSDDDENLFCVNGGTCKEDDPHRGCHCPTAFTGHKCEIPKLNSNDDDDDTDDDYVDAVDCGGKFCLNGGRCIDNTPISDGSDAFVCDCTDAYDETHRYAGPACQYKSTSFCTDDQQPPPEPGSDLSTIDFCVNGGTCPTGPGPVNCNCLRGWTGPNCQFHQPFDDPTPDDDTDDPDACGDNICLNDGTCVSTTIIHEDDTQTIRQHCDCSTASDHLGRHFAGENCQFPSTSICTNADADVTNEEEFDDQFFCTNHGTCKEDYFRGCDCPAGFTGFVCEFEDVHQDPNDNSDIDDDYRVEECGNYICHNGGSCITTTMSSPDGSTPPTIVKHCDCSTSATDYTIYAGDECQYEQTSFCSLPEEGAGLETAFFCVNHGTCHSTNPRQGCDCSTGWTGFHCEFAQSVSDIIDDFDDPDNDDEDGGVVECGDSFCYNGGQCHTSQEPGGDDSPTCDCSFANTGDVTELYAGPTCQYVSEDICSPPDDSTGFTFLFCVNGGTCNDDGTECNCLPGWTGRLCDVAVEDDQHSHLGVECGDGYCYNGGECVRTVVVEHDGTETPHFHCDCTFAFTETDHYAGDSCQHKSTSFCNHPHVGDSLQDVLFCTNGGACKENALHGCDCPPQWTGFNCEYEKPPEDVAEELNNNDNNGGGGDNDVEVCGDSICLHGGECVTTTIINKQGETHQSYHCDCSTAVTDTDLYAGPQCEHKSTRFCTQPAQDATNLMGVRFCVNGGACRDNVAQGCDCPPAWTGTRCEFQVEADDIDDEHFNNEVSDYVPCGDDAFCYHGGTCQTEQVFGETRYSCNCETAVTATDLYDGDECQYKSTTFCSQPTGDSLSGIQFCVNGGQCQDSPWCACPTGYKGYRCEQPIYANQDSEDNIQPAFPDEDDDGNNNDPYQECHLRCKNNGVCSKGAKYLGDAEDHIQSVSHLNSTFDDSYFEHCVCPHGWIGLECQHQAETCGDEEEHLCLHGSTCIKRYGKHTCDCSTTNEMVGKYGGFSLFAGPSCQHPATDVCIVNPTDPNSDPANYFCVNHGMCKSYVDDVSRQEFPGCNCIEGWYGQHCESRFAEDDTASSVDVGKTKQEILILVMIVVVVVIGTVVAASCCFRSQKNNDRMSRYHMREQRREAAVLEMYSRRRQGVGGSGRRLQQQQQQHQHYADQQQNNLQRVMIDDQVSSARPFFGLVRPRNSHRVSDMTELTELSDHQRQFDNEHVELIRRRNSYEDDDNLAPDEDFTDDMDEYYQNNRHDQQGNNDNNSATDPVVISSNVSAPPPGSFDINRVTPSPNGDNGNVKLNFV